MSRHIFDINTLYAPHDCLDGEKVDWYMGMGMDVLLQNIQQRAEVDVYQRGERQVPEILFGSHMLRAAYELGIPRAEIFAHTSEDTEQTLDPLLVELPLVSSLVYRESENLVVQGD